MKKWPNKVRKNWSKYGIWGSNFVFLTFFWIRGVTEATGASEQVSLTEKYFWIFFESEKIFVWSPQISPWGEKDVKVPDLQRSF